LDREARSEIRSTADRPLFCSGAAPSVIPLDGDPYDGSTPLQRLDRGFHPCSYLIWPWLMSTVNQRRTTGDALRPGLATARGFAAHDRRRFRKSILARKSGCCSGLDIAKLVGKTEFGRPAAPASKPLVSRFAARCKRLQHLDKPPATDEAPCCASPLLCILSPAPWLNFWVSL